MTQYPLEQLAQIKKKKLEEAERVLNEKKEALRKEQEKLAEVEKHRDKTKQHKEDKLTQLREELDRGSTSTKIEQMKRYLKLVQEDLAAKEKLVSDQMKQLKIAEGHLETARKDLQKKQKDVEKLKIHEEEWGAEQKIILAHEEEVASDEQGSAMHIMKTSGRLPSSSSRKKRT